MHNRLTQHVSGTIMPIVRRTDCIKPRMVFSLQHRENLNFRDELISTLQILPILQANTTRGFIQSVLLTMDIMMPETC